MTEDELEEGLAVEFTAGLRKLKLPGHYKVVLMAEGYYTGVETNVWGAKRAIKARDWLLENANALLNHLGVAEQLMEHLLKTRRAKALAEVKVGASVKLATDIGFCRKGRICKVVGVDPGGKGIVVRPVFVSGDPYPFGDGDSLPLAKGEYVGINEEVPE